MPRKLRKKIQGKAIWSRCAFHVSIFSSICLNNNCIIRNRVILGATTYELLRKMKEQWQKKKCLQDMLSDKVRILSFLLLLALPYCEFYFSLSWTCIVCVYPQHRRHFSVRNLFEIEALCVSVNKVGCQQFDYYRFIPHSKFIFKRPPPLIQCFITFHFSLSKRNRFVWGRMCGKRFGILN